MAAAATAGMPAAPVSAATAGLGVNAVTKIREVFHERRVRKTAALHDSAYAYLYYAERELDKR